MKNKKYKTFILNYNSFFKGFVLFKNQELNKSFYNSSTYMKFFKIALICWFFYLPMDLMIIYNSNLVKIYQLCHLDKQIFTEFELTQQCW